MATSPYQMVNFHFNVTFVPDLMDIRFQSVAGLDSTLKELHKILVLCKQVNPVVIQNNRFEIENQEIFLKEVCVLVLDMVCRSEAGLTTETIFNNLLIHYGLNASITDSLKTKYVPEFPSSVDAIRKSVMEDQRNAEKIFRNSSEKEIIKLIQKFTGKNQAALPNAVDKLYRLVVIINNIYI